MNLKRTARRLLVSVFGSRSGLLVVALLLVLGALTSGSRLAARAAQARQATPQSRAQDPPPSRVAAQPQPALDQQPATDITPEALAQIAALLQEKASRTPVERKIDSQLLYALKMARGQAIAAGVVELDTDLPRQIDAAITIDVTGTVDDGLQRQMLQLGAQMLDTDTVHGSMRLVTHLDQIEAIAALPQVLFVQPKQEALTSRIVAPVDNRRAAAGLEMGRARARTRLDRDAFAAAVRNATEGPGAITSGTGQGSKTSEGDATHRAYAARGTFHVTGAGVKIGVLSDGVTNLAASQALGDLGTVTVLPGQTGAGDEGTAMLEIIHDLAPGAQLYFATAFTSITSFAQNIRDLRTAGCDIIVDDVGYYVETPFQDGQSGGPVSTTNAGVVIQAVKDVSAAGALYFSSAANSGNKNDGTSGTWEGDFLSGGATAVPLPLGGDLHNFGGQNFDVLNTASGNPITLHWSDPLGGSGNDYDLFRLNSTGTTVLGTSANIQSGTQDPYEQLSGAGSATGQRIVIVRNGAAAGRFLHLSTNRGTLSISTQGETHGHSSTTAANSFSVAATPAVGPFPNPFSGTNVVETFSSDGPRRIFFTQAGAPITPGNVSSTGGQLLAKPDITAADGTSVTGVGGFPSPFFGTSAAAPHAAAIAGLVKSANAALTPAQIRAALISSAIDIEAAGVDRDSGAGIIMAYTAVQSTGATGTAFLAEGVIAATENPGNGDGALNAGEGGKIIVPFTNLGVATATGVSAALTTSTPGVTLVQPAVVTYPDIAVSATATNTTTPFKFTLASTASCPLTVSFTLTLTYTGASPQIITFQVATGPIYTITTTLDATAPVSSPGVTATSGMQTGRLTRNGVVSTCATPKTNPGLFDAVARRYDNYAFNSCPGAVASCATITLTASPLASGLNLFTAANAPSFTPADPSANYKGDPGVSSSTTATYSVPLAAGAPFAVDVHEVTAGGGLGTNYTMTVTGACFGSCAPPNQVPIARAHDVAVVAGAGGTASASIDNGSSDPDGDALTITQSPPGPYAIGSTGVLLTVVDPKGATSQATATVTVTAATAPTMSLDRTSLNFGATSNGSAFVQQTTTQTVRIQQTGAGTVTWTATPSQPWLTVTPASGTGSATLTVGLTFVPGLPVSGTASATIALAFTGASNGPGPVNVGLRVMPVGTSVGSIGVFDTPADGVTGVTGSIAVTGWALDDVQVNQVRILRDPVAGEGTAQIFIGNAVFVDGSRPDVAALNSGLPRFTRAGWGYLLLTNFLPGLGNGTFKLYAVADDADGHSVVLGSRTITCTNATATLPFGAIDTPGQGEVVSGAAYSNFGWVLARGPALAYPPFGTVAVVIDGAFGAPPVGWTSRADLTALFPAATYPGITNALGVATLDTTALTNGVHTIAWVVTTNTGQADGVGSRYFTVANSSLIANDAGDDRGADSSNPALEAPALMPAVRLGARASGTPSLSLREEVNAAPPDRAAITGRRGYDIDAPFREIGEDAEGRVTMQGEELDRFELQLRGGEPAALTSGAGGSVYTGYMRVGDDLGPLPIGSRLDPATGEFTWQPGVGFTHAYDLVFVRWDRGGAAARQEVRIVLNPKRRGHVGPQVVIDTPASQADVAQPFVLAGWAVDADAANGTGVDTLHVWAYPLAGGDPIFVGATAYGGERPDVAALLGDRFRGSGYGLKVEGLAPGNYDLAVFAWSTAQNQFVPAKTVRVTVR